jgi:hypothetical protein
MPRNPNADLAKLVHTGGSFSRVLADFPTDLVEATAPGPRLRSLTRALRNAGSSDSDIAKVTHILEEHAEDRTLIPRLLLVRDGELLVDELLPSTPLQADEASYDELPNLIPLIMQRQSDVPYIVLEATASGGRIRTFLTGRLRSDSDAQLVGETEHLHEAHGGGLSHPRHAHHTEEVWKRNETELAEAINGLVARNVVHLLIVTGDPHIVDLVSKALSARARAILVTLASDTRAAGASHEMLNELLNSTVQRLVDERKAGAIGRAAEQEAANNSGTDQRLQPIVHALQQAGVSILLLDLEALKDHTLLSLEGAPWVASVAAETFGARILRAAPAAEALARAAIATDAEVIIVDHDTWPSGAGAAIVHR